MFRMLMAVFMLLPQLSLMAQYKNDNVSFKTVDPSELCTALEKNKGYILLDVRSKGEHYDTSGSPAYNLGHLKGAINIDVRELGKRLSEIRAYTDKPVFVYCSHSQRSRRAGKLLADSGFNKVFNINGGMTAIYYTSAAKNTCLQGLLETHNPYTIISAMDLCAKLNSKSVPFVLDVRSDSAFRQISLNSKENAYGYIKGSVNIPLKDLSQNFSKIPKEREVVVTDMYGDESARAALTLMENGYKNVSVLIEGIDRLLYTDEQVLPCKKTLYVSAVSYQLMSASEFGRYTKAKNDFLLLDIRSADEFANKHKDSWRNIGNLKGAVNIPLDDLGNRIAELAGFKQKEVVIYGFSSSPEVFNAATYLQKNGFTKINVLMGGIFNLRWTAANTMGNSALTSLVTNVPEINQ